jgi:serine/threonine protein kinase/Tol biopolymer transport system component
VDPSGDLLSLLAADVLDRSPIDWDAVRAKASPSQLPVVGRLETIAAMLALSQSPDAAGPESAVASGAVSHDAPPTWGPLRLLEPIGHGAFGRVYRAWDSRLDRQVALKFLDRDDVHAEMLSTAVVEEGRLMARIRHPNVAAVFGADRIDGLTGVWMEFIDGVTLEELLRTSGPLDAAGAARMGIDLCRALSAVHDAGLLHQDIKAQNVMRENGGRTVLMDFGAGVEQSPAPAGPEFTSAATIAGTPLYLAPERFEGAAPTVRGDIYSLGVLLYHLATGGYPVNAGTMDGVKAAHRHGQRVPLRNARPDMAPHFVSVVDRAIDHDPARRWASAADMGAALAEGTAPPPGPLARRHRGIAAAAAVATTLAVVATAANFTGIQQRVPWLAQWRGTPHSPLPSSPSTRQLEVPAFSYVGGPSLDGRYLPILTYESSVAIVDLATGKSRVLASAAPSVGEAESVALSSDGRLVAYGWRRGDHDELVVAPTDGAAPRTLPRLDGVDILAPVEWTRDGRRVLTWLDYDDGSSTVALVDVGDGRLQTIGRFAGNKPSRVSLSPDARFLVYDQIVNEPSGARDIYILDVVSGAARVLVSHPADDGFAVWTPDGSGVFFIREVAGARSGWVQRVVDGRAEGDAVSVARGLGPIVPTGFTADGALLYQFQSGECNLFVVRLSPGESRAISAPEVVPSKYAGAANAPGWSHDGRFLASVSTLAGMGRDNGRRVITIRDMQTGEERDLEPPISITFQPLRWSPDDLRLLVNGIDRDGRFGARIVDASDGRMHEDRAVPVQSASKVSSYGPSIWHPGGHAVLYQHGPRGLVLRDLASGSEQVVLSYQDQPFSRINRFGYAPDTRRLGFSAFLSNAADPKRGVALYVRTGDGPCRELVRSQPGEILSFQGWMPDGKSLLFSRWSLANVAEHSLWLVSASGGPPRPLGLTLKEANTWTQPVQVKPDGSALVFAAGQIHWDVGVMERFLTSKAR